MKWCIVMLFTFSLNSCQLITVDISDSISDLFSSSYELMSCPLTDCCNNHWIPNNITKLQALIKNEVFGQHIATQIISSQLFAHLRNPRPAKPLVMSFHGWPGNGKSHMARLIAKGLYKKEIKSRFFHHIMATVHFPHQEHAQSYQDQVRTWVKGNVSHCPHSLFVFDEVDKMPSAVLNGIKAYLDHNDEVDGVDYRKAIFIFLSNTGGNNIFEIVYDTWTAGKVERNELTLKDFERLVELGAFNEKVGGLHGSYLIEKSLIYVYVPFLPMEKSHVRLCAENELRNHNYVPQNKEAALQEIVDGLNYYPDGKEIYSTSGCRGVANKVSNYIAGEQRSQRGTSHNEL